MKKTLLCLLVLVGSAFAVGDLRPVLGQEFYKGKTIRFIVGYGPGGGYDTYTRAAARHIGRHIPGNPTTVVENMEGAGSLLAANYIYNRADPEGLTVGNWNSGMVLLQALGGKGIRFDAAKFGWIGAPLKGSPVCAIMAFTGPKTLDEIIASKKEIKFGGTAPGAITDDGPRIMNLLMGTKFKVISGYKGSADIRLAMRRKEVDAFCITWDSMRVTARAELEAKGDDRLIPFIFHGKSNDPEVKDLPQFAKVIKGQENLAAWKAFVNPNDFQRPLMAPPKTPKDRLNILRKAYKETVEDPEFLAEAKKSKMLIDYVSGEEIEEFTREILSLPAGAKEKLKFLAEPEK